MKKLLLISYYWPPAGGGGVMRWLKMSAYLQELENWQVIVFHPKEAKYLVIDNSLNATVHSDIECVSYPIFEPNSILSKLGFKSTLKNVAAGGVGANKKPSLISRLMVWVRSNLFIPDARALWIRPASKYLIKNWSEIEADVVISTGPPHSMHLIALALKKSLGVSWIADYRDPWTFIDYADDLNMSQSVAAKHQKLETEVFHYADKVVTVSQTWANVFKDIYNKEVTVINNGFDPADFKDLNDREKGKTLKMLHIGSINKDRNAPVFWKALKKAIEIGSKQHFKIQVELIGNFSQEVLNTIHSLNLEEYVIQTSHLAHREVLQKLKDAHVSLLFINNTSNKGGIIPGKLYEYLAVENPIISIGEPKGDAAQIIQECEAGLVFDYDQEEALVGCICEFAMKANSQENNEIKEKKYLKYSRKELAIKYAKLLEDL